MEGGVEENSVGKRGGTVQMFSPSALYSFIFLVLMIDESQPPVPEDREGEDLDDLRVFRKIWGGGRWNESEDVRG